MGVCFPPFCTSLEFLPLDAGAKVAAAFGGSLFSNGEFSTLLDNKAFPFFLLNGAGDPISFNFAPTGETYGQETYDRLLETKLHAFLKNIDHYSITDIPLPPGRGDIESTLPREEQVYVAVDAVHFYIKKSLKVNGPGDSFCDNIEERGGVADVPYLVDSCQTAFA